MKKWITLGLMGLFCLLLTSESMAQDTTRFYLNAGYLTNLKTGEDSVKPDQGFSIRAGILTKKRLGFYVGYLQFKEFNKPVAGYDDEGRAFLAGIDFLILKSGDFRWYVQAGIEGESFISTYPGGRTEKEFSPKPDLGFLLNLKFFNALMAWQPSDPSHFNLGIGITL